MLMLSRRHLLKTLGTSSAGAVALSLIGGPLQLIRRVEAVSLTADDLGALAPTSEELKALADVALDGARKLGCSYADFQIEYYHDVWAPWPTVPRTQTAVIESQRFGPGVRVIHAGAWGLAAGRGVDQDAIANITAQAVASAQANAALPPEWKDRFGMPIKDSLAFWQTLDGTDNGARGGTITKSGMRFRVEDRFFASTEGRCTRAISVKKRSANSNL
jgi:hypothetical protein